jgi:hypothetical protein
MKKCIHCPRKHRSKHKTCWVCRDKANRRTKAKRLQLKRENPQLLKEMDREKNLKTRDAKPKYRQKNAKKMKKWHKAYSRAWMSQAGSAYNSQRKRIEAALKGGEIKRPKKCCKCKKVCKPVAHVIPDQPLKKVRFFCWSCRYRLTNP